jgi:hypothetical protein
VPPFQPRVVLRRARSGTGNASTRRRPISGEEEEEGASSPREAGARVPLTVSRRGGKGASAWGGCRSARRQAVHDRGGAGRRGAGACRRGARVHDGGVWGRDSGNAGRARSAR